MGFPPWGFLIWWGRLGRGGEGGKLRRGRRGAPFATTTHGYGVGGGVIQFEDRDVARGALTVVADVRDACHGDVPPEKSSG